MQILFEYEIFIFNENFAILSNLIFILRIFCKIFFKKLSNIFVAIIKIKNIYLQIKIT